jgi:hypothetical protein
MKLTQPHKNNLPKYSTSYLTIKRFDRWSILIDVFRHEGRLLDAFNVWEKSSYLWTLPFSNPRVSPSRRVAELWADARACRAGFYAVLVPVFDVPVLFDSDGQFCVPVRGAMAGRWIP